MKPFADMPEPVAGPVATRRLMLRAAASAAATTAGVGALGGLGGCGSLPAAAPASTSEAEGLGGLSAPPPAPREFRAAWVATVANIDWPSRKDLTPEQQRQEVLRLLDAAQALHLNALVLQVRPSTDAIYPSALEPWSEFLTGLSGRAPQPAWDPLAYWLQEAHRRGIELHAWLNPYRARSAAATGELAATHIARTRPELVKRYGPPGQLWMDPGEPESARHTLAVLADLLRRYELDGVHIDDYFYPYPVREGGATSGPELDFPDEPAWTRYRASGGALERADWRRSQVDALVQRLFETTRNLRPQARVGISPFGLPRPDRRPPGISGFSQYDKLYADVERWFEAGWLDYLAPQLYWPIEQRAQAFGVLFDHWLAANRAQRHVWPGLYTSRLGQAEPAPGANMNPREWAPAEILNQLALMRGREAQPSAGHVHFSMVALLQDRQGIAQRLRAGPYAQPALVPATPWLVGSAPARPQVLVEARGGRLRLQLRAGAAAAGLPAADAPWRYALWAWRNGQWQFAVQPAREPDVEIDAAQALVVSAVNRTGLESPRLALRLGA
jgi:uncharacterized lipoprotein YddW (UPF0748 family)